MNALTLQLTLIWVIVIGILIPIMCGIMEYIHSARPHLFEQITYALVWVFFYIALFVPAFIVLVPRT